MSLKTQQELYNEYVIELQSLAPMLTDTNEGSIIDLLAGVMSQAVYENNVVSLENFKKTFFSTANGPEITGGTDDLEYLAIDHFGQDFRRPQAVKSVGTVLFSRPNINAGIITIPANTIVKTSISSFGSVVRFKTVSDVIMTGLSIAASVVALVEGTSGNVNANTVNTIESSLGDQSITVNNSLAFSGGKAAENDVEYRATIINLLQTLKGSTLSSIEAKAKTVSGVVFAKGINYLIKVREWDEATGTPLGLPFFISKPKLYIADVNGNSSQALITAVSNAILSNVAAGVVSEVVGASAFSLVWTATYSLNPTGPNYATLLTSSALITEYMNKYLNDLSIGTGFSKLQANQAVMAKFGPSGTNDLVSFYTTSPTGDVVVTATQKIISGGASIT